MPDAQHARHGTPHLQRGTCSPEVQAGRLESGFIQAHGPIVWMLAGQATPIGWGPEKLSAIPGPLLCDAVFRQALGPPPFDPCWPRGPTAFGQNRTWIS
ncbi:hypothetical protein DB31_0610 [Hyalangium minutum]|uniref:Uncharacterized protein n=1 Tax=Hyalangium minutum TaxID=394096 RepID=A0A085WXD5_9BACT|nr:hypothetical protein DB31_0610 [Hyalangium minutum]